MAGTDQAKEKPDFKDIEAGPLDQNHRKCRDVFCCILFVICIGAMVYCTIHAYINGKPTKVFRGIDRDGVICGDVDGPAKDYPYLYFFNPITSMDNRYCLKQCPYFDSMNTLTVPDCYNEASSSPSCSSYTITVDKNGGISGTPSASSYIGYESTAVIERVCIPSSAVLSDAFKDVVNNITTTLQAGQFATLVQDVKNNWQWLLVGVGFAIVISLLFMFLLRCLVGCIVWISILGSILGFVGLGIIFLYNSGVAVFKNNLGFLGLPTLSGSQYYSVYGYICFGVSGFLLLMLICCCKRIKLAVAVCKVAGQFVIRVCQATLVPIFLAIILIGMWAVCLVCMVYLLSATTFTAYAGDVFTSVKSYSEPSLLRLYFFIFGTLWSNAIIQALEMFIIASACCMWYYNHGAGSQLDSPITRSIKMAFRYHFGSLAFGSFILAFVQLLQMIVELVKKQAENTGAAQQNKCFQYVIICLRCWLGCIQRIVQFMNETAYIQIALRGKNFCSAAKDGFQIILNNGIRYLMVAGIGKLMMFIGRILIAVGTTFAFYCLITFASSIKRGIMEPLYLLLIIFIVSFAIGALFIFIYSIAIDTILVCFIVDEMNQSAKGGKAALYGPSELNELLPESE